MREWRPTLPIERTETANNAVPARSSASTLAGVRMLGQATLLNSPIRLSLPIRGRSTIAIVEVLYQWRGSFAVWVVIGTSGLMADLETKMKKRGLKKLHLAKETLRSMLDFDLSAVAGGKGTYWSTCINCPPTRLYDPKVPEVVAGDTFGG